MCARRAGVVARRCYQYRAGWAVAAAGPACAAQTAQAGMVCAQLQAHRPPPWAWRLHLFALLLCVLTVAASYSLFYASGHTAREVCEEYHSEADSCDVAGGGMPTISKTGVLSPEREVLAAGLTTGALLYSLFTFHHTWLLVERPHAPLTAAAAASEAGCMGVQRAGHGAWACAGLASVGFLAAATVRLDVQYEVHSLGALFLFGGQLGRLLCLCLLVRRRRRAAPDADMPLPSWLLAGHARRLVLLKVAIGLGAAAMVASGIAYALAGRNASRMWTAPIFELAFAALAGLEALVGVQELRVHAKQDDSADGGGKDQMACEERATITMQSQA